MENQPEFLWIQLWSEQVGGSIHQYYHPLEPPSELPFTFTILSAYSSEPQWSTGASPRSWCAQWRKLSPLKPNWGHHRQQLWCVCPMDLRHREEGWLWMLVPQHRLFAHQSIMRSWRARPFRRASSRAERGKEIKPKKKQFNQHTCPVIPPTAHETMN